MRGGRREEGREEGRGVRSGQSALISSIETDFVSRKKNNVFMYIAFSTKRLIKNYLIKLQFVCNSVYICKRLSERSFQGSPEDLSPSACVRGVSETPEQGESRGKKG